MADFNWVISTTEYDLQPESMDGAIIVAHWRCNASQDSGGTVYSATSYGTCGFSPDPSAPGYTPYSQVTEQQCLDWCFADGVDKDAIEASLQANIDAQINPVTASGVPW